MSTPRLKPRATPTPPRVYAHDARPCEVISPEAKSRGSRLPGKRVEVVRYNDTTLYDRMHARAQLSDRQHAAAVRLGHMFVAAGLHPKVSADIGMVRDDPQDDDAPERDPAEDDDVTPLDRYRKVMRTRSPAHAMRLEAMLLDEHPGTAFLATLQSALTDLADRWGIAD